MNDVAVELSDGSIARVRVTGPSHMDVGVGKEVVGKLVDIASHVAQVARDVAAPIVIATSADKVSVEMGFGVTVAEGRLTALLVSGGIDASIKVVLEWERKDGG